MSADAGVLELPLASLSPEQVEEIEHLVQLAGDGNEIAGQRLKRINPQTFEVWIQVRTRPAHGAKPEVKGVGEVDVAAAVDPGRGLARIAAALAAKK